MYLLFVKHLRETCVHLSGALGEWFSLFQARWNRRLLTMKANAYVRMTEHSNAIFFKTI